MQADLVDVAAETTAAELAGTCRTAVGGGHEGGSGALPEPGSRQIPPYLPVTAATPVYAIGGLPLAGVEQELDDLDHAQRVRPAGHCLVGHLGQDSIGG